MQKFVARENIERFRKLIAEAPDGADRARLERMLAEEEEKLRAYGAGTESVASQDRGDDESNRQRP